MPLNDKARKLMKRSVNRRRVFALTVIGAVVLAAMVVALTGGTWRVLAYGLVILFAFLVAESLYFWGAMLLGGTAEALTRRQAVGWKLDDASLLGIPEHDVDPGLELMAAGVLVYRLGEVKPQVYFRKVCLTDARAIRPFVVARTGAPRPYHFHFTLVDESGKTRHAEEFEFDLEDAPRLVMPRCRLILDMPRKLVGQRWSLRVYSGVTVITSFRFMFANTGGPSMLATEVGQQRSSNGSDSVLGWQQELLPALLDDAIKHDVMAQTREIVLEEL